MFLFCEAKAKTASRGREIFPSGKILVTTTMSPPSRPIDDMNEEFFERRTDFAERFWDERILSESGKRIRFKEIYATAWVHTEIGARIVREPERLVRGFCRPFEIVFDIA